jgi:hypothetical protein
MNEPIIRHPMFPPRSAPKEGIFEKLKPLVKSGERPFTTRLDAV